MKLSLAAGIMFMVFALTQVAVGGQKSSAKLGVMSSNQLSQHQFAYNRNSPHQRKKSTHRTGYSGRVFVFSPRHLRWYAYENGRLVRSGKASGGKGYCRDVKRACRTPRGVFRVSRKGGAGCRSSRYPLGRGGARMDYCIFFSKYYAIHGSNNVPNYNASHGCIRVRPSAARWLNRSFLRAGDRVIVKSY